MSAYKVRRRIRGKAREAPLNICLTTVAIEEILDGTQTKLLIWIGTVSGRIIFKIRTRSIH